MTIRRRPRRRPPRRVGREWLTGYLFILPAVVVIAIFGLFPIAYAVYMSLYSWRVRQGAYLGLENYARTLGHAGGAIAFFGGLLLVLVAHWVWTDAFAAGRSEGRRYVQAAGATLLLASGVSVALGWQLMARSGDRAFLQGLVRTVYYGFGSVPIQIALALVLASLLFQRIRGREVFRMLYFLPYVARRGRACRPVLPARGPDRGRGVCQSRRSAGCSRPGRSPRCSSVGSSSIWGSRTSPASGPAPAWRSSPSSCSGSGPSPATTR
ncbi:MAG: hypothetical protein P8Y02_08105 [Deinococcales bacterium]